MRYSALTLPRISRAASLFILMLAALFLAPRTQASTDIQMLPPTNSSGTCPSGTNQVLIYSGNPNGGINCVPVTADSAGDVTTGGAVRAGSVSATTSVTINGATATATTVDTANALASLLSSCGASGGGTISVNSSGALVCGSTSSPPPPPPFTGHWTLLSSVKGGCVDPYTTSAGSDVPSPTGAVCTTEGATTTYTWGDSDIADPGVLTCDGEEVWDSSLGEHVWEMLEYTNTYQCE